jgi:hypothetical protein
MAKKVNQTLKAVIKKNTEKGGAWLAYYVIVDESGESVHENRSAWTNASACKRWIKAEVIANTSRKSVKMLPVDENLNTAKPTLDAKGKPVQFWGEVAYKVEA